MVCFSMKRAVDMNYLIFFTFQGCTLNSNKTVNISHPNTKLGSKTNVIVIQKGQTKGVTLSHAGKVHRCFIYGIIITAFNVSNVRCR